MASLPNAKRVTYEEWLRMPVVSDAIEEVVDGEIRLMPPAKLKHALIADRLQTALKAQLDGRKYWVLTAEFGLIIRKRPLTSRVPDLAVFEISSVIVQDDYIHSAPQLAVEIRSAGNTRREREEKLANYASLGIPEIWAINPKQRTIDVFYVDNAQLRLTATVSEGLLTPRLFPSVQIDIAGIWPD